MPQYVYQQGINFVLFDLFAEHSCLMQLEIRLKGKVRMNQIIKSLRAHYAVDPLLI